VEEEKSQAGLQNLPECFLEVYEDKEIHLEIFGL
jgi:hypothetical protein